MKSTVNKHLLILALLLVGSLFQASQTFAQEKEKSAKDGTIRIRIEKQIDGKTEVIEKTYKPGEWPGNLPESILFNFSDSFSDFGENFHRQFDTVFSKLHIPDMSFHFDNNNLLQKEIMDSLLKKHQQLSFTFEHALKPSLDSSFHKLLDARKAFKFHFDNDFAIDSMLDLQMEGMGNFQFNWSGDGPENKEFNLLLDKELYDIEETEDARGNKMIRITPKTDRKKDTSVPFKNLRGVLQPSTPRLDLHHNAADRSLTVGLTLAGTEDTMVTVTDPKGKEVYKENLKNFSGSYQKVIKLKKGRKGVYEVQVIRKDTRLAKKLEIP